METTGRPHNMGHLHNTGRHQLLAKQAQPQQHTAVMNHILDQRAARSQVRPRKARLAGLHATGQHNKVVQPNAGLRRGAGNGLRKTATARLMKRLYPIGELLHAPMFDMSILEVLISPVVEMCIKM